MGSKDETPLQNCDVDDFDSLRSYRKKRRQWAAWLRTDSEHALSTQLVKMTWNHVVFKLINEALRIASAGKCSESYAVNNRMIFDFVVEGYLASQLLAIRKLTDARKDVISLHRIMRDIVRNRRLITRQNYVCFDGVPYEGRPENPLPEESYLPGTGSGDWITSHARHSQFDRIAVSGGSKCERRELISNNVINKLNSMVNRTNYVDLLKYCDSFLTHASDDTSSRSESMKHRLAVTIDRLEKAHKTLLSAHYILAALVVNDSAMVDWVPVPQFDKMEHLERPWVPVGAKHELRQSWNAYDEQLDNWRKEAVHEFLANI